MSDILRKRAMHPNPREPPSRYSHSQPTSPVSQDQIDAILAKSRSDVAVSGHSRNSGNSETYHTARTFEVNTEMGGRKLMSEDEVSSLVHNALRRARQATSSVSPRHRTSTSVRSGGLASGTLSPNSISASTVSSRPPTSPTKSSSLFFPGDGGNGSAGAVDIHSQASFPRPRNHSRGAVPMPSTASKPIKTDSSVASEDNFAAPSIVGSHEFSSAIGSSMSNISNYSSDFQNPRSQEDVLSDTPTEEDSITEHPALTSVNSSEDIIRRVEEEIANARRAAQEANRRLAGVSANLRLKGFSTSPATAAPQATHNNNNNNNTMSSSTNSPKTVPPTKTMATNAPPSTRIDPVTKSTATYLSQFQQLQQPQKQQDYSSTSSSRYQPPASPEILQVMSGESESNMDLNFDSAMQLLAAEFDVPQSFDQHSLTTDPSVDIIVNSTSMLPPSQPSFLTVDTTRYEEEVEEEEYNEAKFENRDDENKSEQHPISPPIQRPQPEEEFEDSMMGYNNKEEEEEEDVVAPPETFPVTMTKYIHQIASSYSDAEGSNVWIPLNAASMEEQWSQEYNAGDVSNAAPSYQLEQTDVQVSKSESADGNQVGFHNNTITSGVHLESERVDKARYSVQSPVDSYTESGDTSGLGGVVYETEKKNTDPAVKQESFNDIQGPHAVTSNIRPRNYPDRYSSQGNIFMRMLEQAEASKKAGVEEKRVPSEPLDSSTAALSPDKPDMVQSQPSHDVIDLTAMGSTPAPSALEEHNLSMPSAGSEIEEKPSLESSVERPPLEYEAPTMQGDVTETPSDFQAIHSEDSGVQKMRSASTDMDASVDKYSSSPLSGEIAEAQGTINEIVDFPSDDVQDDDRFNESPYPSDDVQENLSGEMPFNPSESQSDVQGVASEELPCDDDVGSHAPSDEPETPMEDETVPQVDSNLKALSSDGAAVRSVEPEVPGDEESSYHEDHFESEVKDSVSSSTDRDVIEENVRSEELLAMNSEDIDSPNLTTPDDALLQVQSDATPCPVDEYTSDENAVQIEDTYSEMHEATTSDMNENEISAVEDYAASSHYSETKQVPYDATASSPVRGHITTLETAHSDLSHPVEASPTHEFLAAESDSPLLQRRRTIEINDQGIAVALQVEEEEGGFELTAAWSSAYSSRGGKSDDEVDRSVQDVEDEPEPEEDSDRSESGNRDKYDHLHCDTNDSVESDPVQRSVQTAESTNEEEVGIFTAQRKSTEHVSSLSQTEDSNSSAQQDDDSETASSTQDEGSVSASHDGDRGSSGQVVEEKDVSVEDAFPAEGSPRAFDNREINTPDEQELLFNMSESVPQETVIDLGASKSAESAHSRPYDDVTDALGSVKSVNAEIEDAGHLFDEMDHNAVKDTMGKALQTPSVEVSNSGVAEGVEINDPADDTKTKIPEQADYLGVSCSNDSSHFGNNAELEPRKGVDTQAFTQPSEGVEPKMEDCQNKGVFVDSGVTSNCDAQSIQNTPENEVQQKTLDQEAGTTQRQRSPIIASTPSSDDTATSSSGRAQISLVHGPETLQSGRELTSGSSSKGGEERIQGELVNETVENVPKPVTGSDNSVDELVSTKSSEQCDSIAFLASHETTSDAATEVAGNNDKPMYNSETATTLPQTFDAVEDLMLKASEVSMEEYDSGRREAGPPVLDSQNAGTQKPSPAVQSATKIASQFWWTDDKGEDPAQSSDEENKEDTLNTETLPARSRSPFLTRAPSPQQVEFVVHRREAKSKATTSDPRPPPVSTSVAPSNMSVVTSTVSQDSVSSPTSQTSYQTEFNNYTNRSNKVRFKQRYPVPPLISKPRPADNIIADHHVPPEGHSAFLSKPKADLAQLLEAAGGSSLQRRSNACGALKVLTMHKKNQLTLVRTAGVLDALVFATCTKVTSREMDAAIDARTRAVAAICNISQPKDNREIVFSHPGLAAALVKTAIEDKFEARAAACGALAVLAKTPSNREPMAKTTNLVNVLAMILSGVKGDPDFIEKNKPNYSADDEGSDHRSFSSDSESSASWLENDYSHSHEEDEVTLPTVMSMREQKREKVEETIKQGRVNACAALVHISKQCGATPLLCYNGKLMDALINVARIEGDPMHSKYLEIMCNLTRFPHNNDHLAKYPGFVDTLVVNGNSSIGTDRVWALRTLQNLSSDVAGKTVLANRVVLEMLSVCVMRDAYDEKLAATATLYNLSTEPGAVVPLTNTKNVVATLVHVAHNPESPSKVRQMACDALATLGLWLQTLAGAGSVPTELSGSNVTLPSYVTSGWQRWDN